MWKCPKCETLNKYDVCQVCGESKPIVDERNPAIHQYEQPGVPDDNEPTPIGVYIFGGIFLILGILILLSMFNVVNI